MRWGHPRGPMACAGSRAACLAGPGRFGNETTVRDFRIVFSLAPRAPSRRLVSHEQRRIHFISRVIDAWARPGDHLDGRVAKKPRASTNVTAVRPPPCQLCRMNAAAPPGLCLNDARLAFCIYSSLIVHVDCVSHTVIHASQSKFGASSMAFPFALRGDRVETAASCAVHGQT
jgi:hypothetical protein